jgi:predicted HTH transcriptional regulator
MCYWHALPDGWESMEYQQFLEARREGIARVIRDAYRKLAGDAAAQPAERIAVSALVSGGESTTTEFKSALRVNLHTKQPDPRIELSCLKTIAGFLNSKGGTLIIGVSDDGVPIGVPEVDGFENEDKMNLHLGNLISARMGTKHMMYIHPRFEVFEEARVMTVDCWPSKSPVFVKDGSVERFFIRAGASTAELPGSEAQDYIRQRF